jgi:magnesium-transporting ATPase (P-type)
VDLLRQVHGQEGRPPATSAQITHCFGYVLATHAAFLMGFSRVEPGRHVHRAYLCLQVGLVSRDALDASNLLLRGCTLRKTEWVIGVVVFTG